MKKVLFATTALIATAGMAAADISFSGLGRFGVQYVEDRGDAEDIAINVIDPATGEVVPGAPIDVGQSDAILESRFRLNIDASTETDAGVEFGGRIRIEANEARESTSNQGAISGARLHAEFGGFRLEVGNISHALDNNGDLFGFGIGLTSFLENNSAFQGSAVGFSSTGAGVQGVSAIYNVGDFRGQLSYSGDNDDEGVDGAEVYSVSLGYTFSGWTVSLGYENADNGDATTDDIDGTILTASGSIGAVDISVLLADDEIGGTSYGISGKYAVSASTDIRALISGGGDDNDSSRDTAYGIGFDHKLGGGVNLKGGVGQNVAGNTVADLGVTFNF